LLAWEVFPDVLHATEPILEASKPPGSFEDPPDKEEGAGLRPVHVSRKAHADAVECMALEVITVRRAWRAGLSGGGGQGRIGGRAPVHQLEVQVMRRQADEVVNRES
jgi:hypothetical protein